MDRSSRVTFERGAVADLWRTTCARIPSVYGRLLYLSSLRNPDTGHYSHEGLTQIFGEAEADRALRQVHNQTFSEWLCFDLEHQKADLDLYLSAFGQKKHRTVDSWDKLKPYRGVVPSSASAVSIQYFESNFQTLLDLLKSAYAASSLE